MSQQKDSTIRSTQRGVAISELLFPADKQHNSAAVEVFCAVPIFGPFVVAGSVGDPKLPPFKAD